MEIEFITPDKTVYKGAADAVKVPGASGAFEVLTNHAPIISNLTRGQVSIKSSDGAAFYNIGGGIVEVLHNHITLLAEEAQQIES